MTIDIMYVDGHKGAVLAGSGRLKGSEFLAANEELFARDFVADPLLYVLFDADQATAIDVTSDDVRDIANQDLRVSHQLPHLIVAIYAQEKLTFGLARMWQVYVAQSGWETAVFQDRTEAVNWLKKEVTIERGRSIELQ
jgi:hypothetical protein